MICEITSSRWCPSFWMQFSSPRRKLVIISPLIAATPSLIASTCSFNALGFVRVYTRFQIPPQETIAGDLGCHRIPPKLKWNDPLWEDILRIRICSAIHTIHCFITTEMAFNAKINDWPLIALPPLKSSTVYLKMSGSRQSPLSYT